MTPTSTSDESITVPVMLNFSTNEVIGHLTISADKLPASPDFVLALGYKADLKRIGLQPGDIPRSQYDGPYELVSVALVRDADYAAYLDQVGVTGVAPADLSARG